MKIIENAWKVPLTNGGIFRIVVNDSSIEFYRIFSGKYIAEELKLKKDMEYIDSLIVPGATDPVEPEDLFNRIKNMVQKITSEYYEKNQAKTDEISKNKTAQQYEKINLTDIKNISLSDLTDDKFPELIINDERFLMPFENFTHPSNDDKSRYKEYSKIILDIKNSAGIK
ncbi:MAG: hypothetical protein RE471_05120 [Ferroplasma sp.]|uniref:hypothetical protein n=1 Tax=Ferroplasma sp. TaxID=2591003 RepID=UPI0028149786|nr:hypothetical protein [Ferroplasma sp.]WMT52263.1 MAG: hypothetical protein RE471_05120 [Ferroplasma sp.]